MLLLSSDSIPMEHKPIIASDSSIVTACIDYVFAEFGSVFGRLLGEVPVTILGLMESPAVEFSCSYA